ncbi:metallophosphoesterase family protein [Xanthocytophaga agilis]|uniref:Metallophosphoesterase family protein n=1 Tax=Xanthocytophaga agilis TaxID=3048010 RepID=A0AAE3R0U9_9BACT|nr:metallophosphoesterase family protein [Xanthocytophaga agilis]MDJ1499284.1 metallophosphoesterase family protein [Xanthocytophaga agilis]
MTGTYVKKTKAGRRFAIGDIHGCFDTFRALVEDQIGLTQSDQLFLLGDYINRGPKQTKVLDYIIQLRASQYEVYPLRGNHEQMLLADRLDEIIPPYRDFFIELPYYYETDHFYLVHAGLNFLASDPLEDTYSMLWMRQSPLPDEEFLNQRKVVHGHTIHSLSEITLAIKNREPILPLDNGCYRGLREAAGEYGNLCALNLDSFELITQKNVDRQG